MRGAGTGGLVPTTGMVVVHMRNCLLKLHEH